MAIPTVTDTTTRIYNSLPEFMRIADSEQPDDGYPLLRYLSLSLDQLDEIEQLIDRIDYVYPDEGGADGDTSDLGDPTTADAAWLPWIGQFVGVTVNQQLSIADQRTQVLNAPEGWLAGSNDSIGKAVQTRLTGTKYVALDFEPDTDPFAITIITLDSETPDYTLIIPTVIALGAAPAGVTFSYTAYASVWDVIEDQFPTWDSIEALGTWDALAGQLPGAAAWSVLESTFTTWTAIEAAGSWDAFVGV